jgi:hypothetical protein
MLSRLRSPRLTLSCSHALTISQTMAPKLDNSARKSIACGVCVVLIIIGFAAAELAIFVGGKFKPLSSAATCPRLNVTDGSVLTLRKDV